MLIVADSYEVSKDKRKYPRNTTITNHSPPEATKGEIRNNKDRINATYETTDAQTTLRKHAYSNI